jgi:hypothetical protein
LSSHVIYDCWEERTVGQHSYVTINGNDSSFGWLSARPRPIDEDRPIVQAYKVCGLVIIHKLWLGKPMLQTTSWSRRIGAMSRRISDLIMLVAVASQKDIGQDRDRLVAHERIFQVASNSHQFLVEVIGRNVQLFSSALVANRHFNLTRDRFAQLTAI